MVVLDALIATSFGVAGLASATNNNGAAAAALFAASAVFIGSSIHGSHVVDQCRGAQNEYLAQVSPPPLPPPVADQRPMLPVPPVLPPRPEPAAEPPQQPPPAPPPRVVRAPEPDDPWRDFWRAVP